MELPGPGGSRRTRTVKRKMWGGLRQWKLLGMFEIDQQHEFYCLTSMMKEGLSAAVQNTIDNPIPVSKVGNLQPEKYSPCLNHMHVKIYKKLN